MTKAELEQQNEELKQQLEEENPGLSAMQERLDAAEARILALEEKTPKVAAASDSAGLEARIAFLESEIKKCRR